MINNIYPDVAKDLAKMQHERMLAESANSRLVSSLKQEQSRSRAGRMVRPLAIAAVLIVLLGVAAVSIALAGAG